LDIPQIQNAIGGEEDTPLSAQSNHTIPIGCFYEMLERNFEA
jgi:hypothetical protein